LTDSSPDPAIEWRAPRHAGFAHKLPRLNPDLVTLDIEMPEMDGLATLPELRRLLTPNCRHYVLVRYRTGRGLHASTPWRAVPPLRSKPAN